VPSPEQIIQEHLEYYWKIEDNTREQQLRREEKIVQDYEGRVLIELFQNAVESGKGEHTA